MDVARQAVAERLADEFKSLPSSTVIRVVTDAVAECPDDDAMLIEQAARARLAELSAGGSADDE